MSYIVYYTNCTYQDNDSADYEEYCSDGKIREYRTLRDSFRRHNENERIPTWRTKEGEILELSHMSYAHRYRVLCLLENRLNKGIDNPFHVARCKCLIAALNNSVNNS